MAAKFYAKLRVTGASHNVNGGGRRTALSSYTSATLKGKNSTVTITTNRPMEASPFKSGKKYTVVITEVA